MKGNRKIVFADIAVSIQDQVKAPTFSIADSLRHTGAFKKMLFNRNLHAIDRLARLVIGPACLYLAIVDSSFVESRVLSVLIGMFGAVNVFAGLTAHCPVYHIAGFSTAFGGSGKND